MMIKTINFSAQGYSHVDNNKPCQDYSLSYQDNERAIIAVADGHGGATYIRSQFGSKYACEAILDEFRELDVSQIKKNKKSELEDKIKISLLCRWNEYIEKHFAQNKFRKKELEKLDEDQIFGLKTNFTKAYGTTMAGAMQIGKYYLIVSLGDTEVMGINSKTASPIFDTSDDPAGNITYSLCQEDAFRYIRVKICKKNEYKGILLCTDGLCGPYHDYKNFNESFVKPTLISLSKGNDSELEQIIKTLASRAGNGDDVSIGLLIQHK